MQLEVRYQSSKETTSFRLAAKLAAKNGIQSVLSEIRRAVEALNEAYDNICKYEADIL